MKAEIPAQDRADQELGDEAGGDLVVEAVAAFGWSQEPGPSRSAGRVARLLAGHSVNPAGIEVQSGVIDVISDVLHLADALDLDMDYVLDMAWRNHDEECGANRNVPPFDDRPRESWKEQG